MNNKIENENFYYLCYVLGYDLLQDALDSSLFNDNTSTFNACKEIIKQFLTSKENKNISKSQYDALCEFLVNERELVSDILDKYTMQE